MPEHLRENLLTHISLLAISNAKQQTDIKNLVDLDENKMLQLGKSFDSKIAALQTKVTRLEQQNTASDAEIKSSKTNLTALQTKVTRLEQEKQLLTISTAKQQADITTSVKENKQLKMKIAELAPVQPMLTVNSRPLGAPVLTMTNFQQHKRDDDIWNSPPVYTYHQGYKICLEVYANGRGTGEGTHVSVSMHFMRGEFDDSLKWPFRGVISIELLDQVNGKDNKTYTNIYDNKVPNRTCARVTKGERSVGRGYSKFIAHTKLEPNYLRNDTLLFQIHKVELK